MICLYGTVQAELSTDETTPWKHLGSTTSKYRPSGAAEERSTQGLTSPVLSILPHLPTRASVFVHRCRNWVELSTSVFFSSNFSLDYLVCWRHFEDFSHTPLDPSSAISLCNLLLAWDIKEQVSTLRCRWAAMYMYEWETARTICGTLRGIGSPVAYLRRSRNTAGICTPLPSLFDSGSRKVSLAPNIVF
jgi:hypothetical protein